MEERQLVYLVRHGQTAWAVQMRHTGQTDIPLTEAGRAEAMVLRPVFLDIEFDLVLSSPLQRAWETCRIAGLVGFHPSFARRRNHRSGNQSQKGAL
ncbi:histidine phosphatase family protein [Desulfopila sp. IMCC35006]|nr:histidine phosphatase family protein [Desulfopila sp. IMCC35006]